MVTVEDIAKLYIAMFGRAPEGEGLNYWYQQALANGWDITQVATNMYYAALQYEDYAFLADPQKLVEAIYENVLGKTYADDPEGIDYWVGQIKSGIIPPGEVAKVIIETAENQYPDHPATKTLHNRVEVALYTAQKIPKFTGDFEAFKDFISIVDDDPLTIQLAERNVDKYWEQVKEEAVKTADLFSDGSAGTLAGLGMTGLLARMFDAAYEIYGSADGGFVKLESSQDGVEITFSNFYYDVGSSYIDGIIKVVNENERSFKVDVVQTLVISTDFLTLQLMGGDEIFYEDNFTLDDWVNALTSNGDLSDTEKLSFDAEDLTVYVNNQQFDYEELKGYLDFYQGTYELQGRVLFEGQEYSFRMSGDDYGNYHLEMQDKYGNSIEVYWSDANDNNIMDSGDHISISFDGEDVTELVYDYLL